MKKMIFLLVLLMLGAIIWFKPDWQAFHTKHQITNQSSILQKIRELNRLESTAFYIDAIIRTEKQGNWYALWQDSQKGIFVAKGNVVAGLDLAKLTEHNISVLNDKVVIQLPPAEILSVQLEHIEIYDLRTGTLNLMPADTTVLNVVQQQAKQQLLREACQNGILEHAKQRTQQQISHLFGLANVAVSVYSSHVAKCAQ